MKVRNSKIGSFLENFVVFFRLWENTSLLKKGLLNLYKQTNGQNCYGRVLSPIDDSFDMIENNPLSPIRPINIIMKL